MPMNSSEYTPNGFGALVAYCLQNVNFRKPEIGFGTASKPKFPSEPDFFSPIIPKTA
jgi:hypothetical protein